jgi:hypothetical protein
MMRENLFLAPPFNLMALLAKQCTVASSQVFGGASEKMLAHHRQAGTPVPQIFKHTRAAATNCLEYQREHSIKPQSWRR